MEISVCLIVLNEEAVLSRILSRVVLFADEIVIVDTGSIDKTIEIARKFTNKVYSFNWVDDFSLARNFAFSKATCSYVMWLDADDFISDANVNKIIELKNQKLLKDTYMFKYSCYNCGEDKPYFTFYRERLLKNCEQAKFIGFIHEVIKPFGKIEFVDIEIEHKKIKSSNPKRNLKIYKKHKFNELSLRDKYYCAKEYYYNGYYKSAIKKLKSFLQNGEFLPNVYDSYITLYDCNLHLGYEDCSILFKCIEKCGLNSEVLCKLGDYYFNKKEYYKAIDYYKCALSCERIDNSLFFIKNEYYYLYPLLQLTCAYYFIDNREKALFYHKKCLEDSPSNPKVIYNERFFKQN